MSLIYSPQTRVLIAGAMHRAMSTTVLTNNVNTSQQWSVTVFQGAQPSAAAIAADWTLYNASPDMLIHFTDPYFFLVQPGNMMQMTVAPASKNALNTGTGAWAIIWSGAVSDAAVAGVALPRTRFLVVPVSDSIGSGVIRFASTSFTSGSPAVIADATLGFNL